MKNIMSRIMLVLAAVLLLTASLCAAASADVVFAFEKAEYEVKLKTSLKLSPILQGAQAPAKAKYVWETSDKNVCTVSANGTVTPKDGGTATITCMLQDGGETLYTAQCQVKVTVPVTKITPKEKKIIMSPRSTYQMVPDVTPANATNQKMIYKLSDNAKDLLTVSEDGTLKVTTKYTQFDPFYLEVVSEDNPRLKVKVEIWIAEFVLTDQPIVLTERKVYRLVLSQGRGGAYVRKLKPACLDVLTEIDKVYDFSAGWYPYINATKESKTSERLLLDVAPKKAGKDTLVLSPTNYFFNLNIQVADSAAFSTKNYPALTAKTLPAAAAGQTVSFKGKYDSVMTQEGKTYVLASVTGIQEKVAIELTDEQVKALELNAKPNMEVYGTFGEPLVSATETGLTMTRQVIIPDKINNQFYVEIEEIDVGVPVLVIPTKK